jgi:hypothetical protein
MEKSNIPLRGSIDNCQIAVYILEVLDRLWIYELLRLIDQLKELTIKLANETKEINLGVRAFPR